MGPLFVELLEEGIEAGLLLEKVHLPWAGGVLSFKVLCMLSCRPFCWGRPGLIEEGIGRGERDTIVRPDGLWQAMLPEEMEGHDELMYSAPNHLCTSLG
jgi:hypothetical protein